LKQGSIVLFWNFVKAFFCENLWGGETHTDKIGPPFT